MGKVSELTKMKANITKIKNSSVNNIIVQFKNRKLQIAEEKTLRASVFKSNKSKTIATVVANDQLYVGNVQRGSVKKDMSYRLILTRSKNTGEFRFRTMDDATLSVWFPEKQSDAVSGSGGPNINALSELKKQFGSKRTKRLTEQRERLQMDIDNAKQGLEHTVANVESESLFMAEAEDDNSYVPSIHRDASAVEDIYVLNEIVPEQVLNSLEEDAVDVLNSNLDDFDLHPFIIHHIRELQDSPASNRVEKCKLLLYINCLITFVTKPAKMIGNKRFTVCESSPEVNNHILQNFSVTSNTGRTRPLSMRDKTVCYILVLTMIALDYQLNLESLSKDCKLGIKKMKEMARVLAFSGLGGKTNNAMVLKLPLPPAVSVAARNKKKK